MESNEGKRGSFSITHRKLYHPTQSYLPSICDYDFFYLLLIRLNLQKENDLLQFLLIRKVMWGASKRVELGDFDVNLKACHCLTIALD